MVEQQVDAGGVASHDDALTVTHGLLLCLSGGYVGHDGCCVSRGVIVADGIQQGLVVIDHRSRRSVLQAVEVLYTEGFLAGTGSHVGNVTRPFGQHTDALELNLLWSQCVITPVDVHPHVYIVNTFLKVD